MIWEKWSFRDTRSQLLLDLNADNLALDEALTSQGRAQKDPASGVWVFGPGTTQYSLSTWPPHKPFLLAAAQQGRANFVDRLTRHYGCDVNYLDKDLNTALHLAAYQGHADVVATLLDSGLISDLTIKNKFDETALDSAKNGMKGHKAPTSIALGYDRIDFTTRNGWPGWVEIICRLEEAEQQEKERIKREVQNAKLDEELASNDDDDGFQTVWRDAVAG